MKMMRLMAATALAVGTVTGVLVESAEARRGRGHSRRSGNENTLQEVDETFLLFTEDPNEQRILDSDNSDLRAFFEGAIEDFNFYTSIIDAGSPFGSIEFDPLTRRPVGFSESDIDTSNSLEFADLEVRRLTDRSQIASELGLDEGDIKTEFGELLVFSVFEPGEQEVPEFKSFLVTDSSTRNDLSGAFIAGDANQENVSVRGDLSADLDKEFLQAIFDNNFLGFSVDNVTAEAIFTGSPTDLLNPGLNDTYNSFFEFINQETPTFIVLDDTFDEVAVPEPGATTTLLALGALGVGLGLKRKLK